MIGYADPAAARGRAAPLAAKRSLLIPERGLPLVGWLVAAAS